MTAEHRVGAELLRRRVAIHVAGAGGNGAQMLACLARLDVAMRALGHPEGLHVTAFDPDKVSEANVGRQLYSRTDVGQFKAVVTITRLNHFYGLDWDASPSRIEEHWRSGPHPRRQADILVGCVDSAAARRTIHAFLFDQGGYAYWLDLGNREGDGQVVIGEPPRRHASDADDPLRLRCVTELYPEILNPSIDDDSRPSCSVKVSLAAQGLFINDLAVRYAAQLLYELFSKGRIAHHGVVCSLTTKRSAPIPIAPDAWARMQATGTGEPAS